MTNGRCICGRRVETSNGVCGECLNRGVVGSVVFGPSINRPLSADNTTAVIVASLLEVALRRAEKAEAENAALRAERERLRALPAKWRRDADFNPWETSPGYRYGLQVCADELDAALAEGQP